MKLKLVLLMSFAIACAVSMSTVEAKHADLDEESKITVYEKERQLNKTPHNWKKTSSQFEMVHADTHEYTVWHNFIKKTRKCDITHRMKTDVWYCEFHNHTKSETSLEETIHSNRHS
ncbi:hypothetical protein GH741_03890 [Aquibacillus halophilus]|uniref:Uncharacterized protein n=1 Tax=Aquibacillus halophilus TaxID=930132 RepID=A0A6A8DKP1_9BACI|nr:hypothetical protein [Aquibacillus halophilus]MRH41812.1 hypothetical protein [Aquibacillus halophilus]